jgi:hypothetical protein
MNPHCKNCRAHWNAGHPKNSPYAKKHNDWCCQFSQPAAKAVGRCKMWNAKMEKANEPR